MGFGWDESRLYEVSKVVLSSKVTVDHKIYEAVLSDTVDHKKHDP